MQNKFTNTIEKMYGIRGIQWLKSLPFLIEEKQYQWSLSLLQPLQNLTYNYVMQGFKDRTQPIILKLCFDPKSLRQEVEALKMFASYGVIKLYDYATQAILLQRAVPGIHLKSFFPTHEKSCLKIITTLINTLHQAPITTAYTFKPLKDVLTIIDKENTIPRTYIGKAQRIKSLLWNYSFKEVLLHGDLHHDNIINNNKQWLAIDPKGIVGPACYEAIACIINPMPALLTTPSFEEIIKDRIHFFAAYFNVSSSIIMQWCFVHSVAAWVWSLEDNLDPIYFIKLTDFFDSLTP